jgi:hypothetical protein
MHARVGEAREQRVGGLAEVDHARHDDRRGAVLQQVHLARQARVLLHDLREQVADRPRHAVALRLTRDHQRVEVEQRLDQREVALADLRAAMVDQHLRPQHGVVLGQRVRALQLVTRARLARDAVEEQRLLERGHERVANAADHRVVGPDDERVLGDFVQGLHVVERVGVDVEAWIETEGVGERGVRAPTPRSDVVLRNDGVRRGMGARSVDPEQRVEDLPGRVCVERRRDLGDAPQVPVDELARAKAVLDGALAAAAGHEQLELGQAERVLHVHEHQADALRIAPRGSDAVLARERARLRRTRRVGHAEHLADATRIEV